MTAGEKAHLEQPRTPARQRGPRQGNPPKDTDMDIQIRTAGIGKWPVVRAMGHDVTLNLYGRTSLLLDLLYRAGMLPSVSAYGKEGSDALFINGENLGTTDQTVQFGIWRMVESYRTSGYLFDDDFALVMRAVGVEPDADEEQAAAEPA